MYCVSFPCLQAEVSCKWRAVRGSEGHRVISVPLYNDGFYMGFCLSVHNLRKLLLTLCTCVRCPLLGWHLASSSKPLIFIFQNSSKFIGKMSASFLVQFKVIPWRVSLHLVSLCLFLIKSFGFSKGSVLCCCPTSESFNYAPAVVTQN